MNTPNNDAVGLLLPFYVNGTLKAEDVERVEHALKSSADLRAELAELQATRSLIQASLDEDALSSMSAAPLRLDKLLAQIETTQDVLPPKAVKIPFPPKTPTVIHRPKFPFGWWKLAFAALAVTVCVQFAHIKSLSIPPNDSDTPYVGLGGSETPEQTGLRLFIKLQPEATWGDVDALLTREGLTIDKGPTGGLLTVRITGLSASDTEHRDAIEERLKTQDTLIFSVFKEG